MINDTPVDDRDIGIEYLGNGKMVANYFRTGANMYLKPDQSFTTADGVLVVGQDEQTEYHAWQNTDNIYGAGNTQAHVQAMINYWSTCNYEDLMSCNVTIVSYDYGNTWSEEIIGGPTAPHGSIQLDNGDLLYVGLASGSIGAHFSIDGGYNWSFQSMIFPSGAINYCEPHVAELPNGRLLAAARAETRGTYTVDETVYTFVGHDLDGQPIYQLGQTYYRITHDKTVTQLTAKPTCYHAYYLATSYSDDGGKTWSAPSIVRDKNGTMIWGSPPEFTVTDEGLVVLSYAIRSGGPNTGVNINLTEYAIVSYDGGETWDTPIELHTLELKYENKYNSSSHKYEQVQTTRTDLGYPSTVYLGNGNFVTLYYQALAGESYTSVLCTRWSLKNTAPSSGNTTDEEDNFVGLHPGGSGSGAQEDWADLFPN